MDKFKKSLALFLSGLPLVSARASADVPEELDTPPSPDPVKLHPLNPPGSNMFAAHRSHSSHSSHRSHRSGSGGLDYRRSFSSPAPPNQPTDPDRPALVSPTPALPAVPQLSRQEKLTLQVMRVQIALTSLGLYDGQIDGQLGKGTKEALKHFQIVKGLPANGLMTTETLNALGVPAVQ